MQKSIKGAASAILVVLLVFVFLNFKALSASAFTSYKVKITAGTLNIRSSASISSKVVGTYSKGTIVDVIGESGDWLKTDKGYISSAYTEKYFTAYKVKITASLLNIRSSASYSGKIVGSYTNGTVVNVIGQAGDWLKTDKGYISSFYTEKYIDSYKVKVTTALLNIRSTASLSGKIVGGYTIGTIVDVIGQTGEWLQTSKGYIYSVYTEKYTESTPAPTKAPTATPTPTVTQAPTSVPTPTAGTSFSSYEVKITTDALNIRSIPSTSGKWLGTYTKGTVVTVIGESGDWLKTDKGYISSFYTEKCFMAYNVRINTAILNIRDIASTSGRIVGTYTKGTVVEVIGQKGDWLQTSKGYIYSIYTEKYVESTPTPTQNPIPTQSLTPTQAPTAEPTPTASPTPVEGETFTEYKVVITATVLNIRKMPTTSSEILSTYTKGTVVTVIGEEGDWLKTDKGYISAFYTIKYFTSYRAVITGSVVNIRSTPSSTGTIVGTYILGTVVNIIGESGDWLQTQKGYVYKDYVQKNTANVKYISINKDCAVLKSVGGQADERYVVAGEKFEVLGEESGYFKIKVGRIEGYIPSDVATVLTAEPVNKLTMAWNYIYARSSNKVYYDSDSDYIRINSAKVGMDIIAPTWFNMSGTYTDPSSITVEDIADSGYVSTAHRNGYDVWATFTETNASRAYAMFTNSTVRENIIKRVVNLALQYNVDGINVDFEALGMKNKDLFTQFIRDLSQRLHEHDITVSVDVVKPSDSDTWSRWYDRGALSQYADYIMYMAYDQNTASSTYPGSVGSRPWVESGIKDILSEGVPASKLVLCVPFYIRDYKLDSSGKVVSSEALKMQAAFDRVKTYGGSTYYDSNDCQTVATYTMNGSVHKVWMEDAKSMGWRMDLINQYDLAGSGAWQLYLETPDIWEVIKSKLK